MDLKSGYPFGTAKNGLLATFPQLGPEHQCDIDANRWRGSRPLAPHELRQHGHNVVVLECLNDRMLEKAQGLADKIKALWLSLMINPTFSWAGTYAKQVTDCLILVFTMPVTKLVCAFIEGWEPLRLTKLFLSTTSRISSLHDESSTHEPSTFFTCA